MVKLSIVIPCYNEQDSLPEVIEKIGKLQSYEDIEFVLVENGSTDKSKEIISQAISTYSNIRMVTVLNNKGYGYGIKMGVITCQGQFVGWTHADLQVDPTDILTAYHELKENNFAQDTFLKGIREKCNRTMTERILTWLMGKWLSRTLGVKMYDINGQPNIYPSVLKKMIIKAPNDVMIEAYSYYMALKLGLTEKRFKVKLEKRKFGNSRLLPGFKARIRTIKRTIMYTRKLRVLQKR